MNTQITFTTEELSTLNAALCVAERTAKQRGNALHALALAKLQEKINGEILTVCRKAAQVIRMRQEAGL